MAERRAVQNGVSSSTEARKAGLPPEKKAAAAPSSIAIRSPRRASSLVFSGTTQASMPRRS